MCLQVSSAGRHTVVEFPLLPSLLSVTEDEKVLLAGMNHRNVSSCRCSCVTVSVSAGSEGTLRLFNIDGDSVDGFLNLQHDDNILSVCVSTDCRLIVSGAADQLIRVRRLTSISFRKQKRKMCLVAVKEQ